MKEGYRFVDCDMHIMEPPDLFDKYLDPAFKSAHHLLDARGRWRQHRHARAPIVVFRRDADQQ